MNVPAHKIAAMLCRGVLLSAVMFVAGAVRAQAPVDAAASAEQPSLSLSPAVVTAKGSFGQSMAQTLTLTNHTAMELEFEMAAEDVTVKDGKRIYIPAGETAGSIAATASFSSKVISVKPNSAANVEARFTIPQGSSLRAVVAVFRGVNKIPTGRGAVSMTASLGTLITFTVSDKFEVSSETMQVAAQSDAGNTTFSQWLTNTGSEPIVPGGVMAVLNESGKLVSKAEIAPQRLLPGEKLEFKAECPSQLEPGKYRVLASYQFEGQTITKAGEFQVQ